MVAWSLNAVDISLAMQWQQQKTKKNKALKLEVTADAGSSPQQLFIAGANNSSINVRVAKTYVWYLDPAHLEFTDATLHYEIDIINWS